MKRIACIAHGPGSANAIKPIIEPLKKKNKIELYAFHPYVSKVWGVGETKEEDYIKIFQEEYDLIIYGTGSGNKKELLVPMLAKERGIKTVSILDGFWMTGENLKWRYHNKPDIVIVPDLNSKDLIIKEKIMEEERIKALGNPYFDRLSKHKKNNLEIKKPLNIVFFSQVSTNLDYSDTSSKSKEAILKLIKIKEEGDTINEITVTAHPRENDNWIKEQEEKGLIKYEKEKGSFELLLENDINIGVNCTLQYESIIIGKPTIFYESYDELSNKLKNIKKINNDRVEWDFDATEKVTAFINEIKIN